MADTTIHVKEAKTEQAILTLESILVKMDGIERALVDMEDGEVKIEYDENQVTYEQITNRIQQHGLHLL
ncbi:MAG TPA: heavy metal-associated domain-containing protein [Bacillus sp. (in: firmicutes)]|nr:heavy metal-associated domain-containing protein [Bacillus sp. (in: firmicutes)]